MKKRMNVGICLFLLWLALPVPGFAKAPPMPDDPKTVVYTMSSTASGNFIYQFVGNDSFNLQLSGTFSTGGKGAHNGIAIGPDSQGALALTADARYLFAVNTGTNDISVFRVNKNDLEFLNRSSSGGVRPSSIAVFGNFVYVLNDLDDTVTGFTLNYANGSLTPIQGGHASLSGPGVFGGQISFNPSGNTLVVTEVLASQVTTFALNPDGSINQRYTIAGGGVFPIGFAFGKRDQFFVANSGSADPAEKLSSVIPYTLTTNGSPNNLINPPVKNGQAGAGWAVASPNGRYVYDANYISGNITSYAVNFEGALTIQNSVAAKLPWPYDMAFSLDEQALYVLSAGDDSQSTGPKGLGIFQVKANGKLSKKKIILLPDYIPGSTGVKNNFVGLVTR